MYICVRLFCSGSPYSNGVTIEIDLIEIEKTGGNLSFEINNVPYVELFPAYHAMEIVESYFGKNIGSRYNNVEIAKRLLEYRIKDA